MKIVILLAAVSAANIFVQGEDDLVEIPIKTKIQVVSGELIVTLPNVPRLQKLAFHANINMPILRGVSGHIGGFAKKNIFGKWIYKNSTFKLQPEDTVHYWLEMRMNGEYYRSKTDIYQVPVAGK